MARKKYNLPGTHQPDGNRYKTPIADVNLRGTALGSELRRSTKVLRNKWATATGISVLLSAICFFVSTTFTGSIVGLVATNLLPLLVVASVFTIAATFIISATLEIF